MECKIDTYYYAPTTSSSTASIISSSMQFGFQEVILQSSITKTLKQNY